MAAAVWAAGMGGSLAAPGSTGSSMADASSGPSDARSPEGPLIELHEQRHQLGRSQRWSAPVADLARSGQPGRVVSVTVWRGRWQLCADTDHAGHCVVIAPGRYGDVERWGLSGLRSLRPTDAEPTPTLPPDANPR